MEHQAAHLEVGRAEVHSARLQHIKRISFHSLLRSGSALVSINKVNLCRAGLVLRWVTVSEFNAWCQTLISVRNRPRRATQPSIPPGLVNKDQLQLGSQRQVWFIPLVDERGVWMQNCEIP